MQNRPTTDGFRGRWASEVDPTPPEKFWYQRLYRGEVNVLVGPSGSAKSLCAARIVADMSRRGEPCVYVDMEQSAGLARLRLDAAGADLSKVRIFDVTDPLYLPDNLDELATMIASEGFKLAVFDTATKTLKGINIYKSGDKAAECFVACSGLAQTTGCAMLFVEHSLKHVPKGADAMFAIPDAIARTARMGILFGYDPEDKDRRAAAWVKDSNDDCAPGMAFEFDAVDVLELTGDGSSDEEDDGTGEIKHGIACLNIVDKDYDISDKLSLVRVSHRKGEGDSAQSKAEAAKFLTDALANGPIPVNAAALCPDHGHQREHGCAEQGCTKPLTAVSGLTDLADEQGLKWRTIRRAQTAIGIEIGKKRGVGKGGMAFWRLPAGHPSLVPNAPTELS